jgi:hypothetical protein
MGTNGVRELVVGNVMEGQEPKADLGGVCHVHGVLDSEYDKFSS